jgi:HSP20 family molecular chaperone IbpA
MALNPFFSSQLDPFSPRGGYSKDFENMTSLAQALMASSAAAAATSGFEIKESDGKYCISVDVPGFKSSDIKVELESGCDCTDCGCRDCGCDSCQCQANKVLHIHGERSTGKEGATSSVRFDKRFTIGGSVDVEKLTANIEHGVLVMEAPKLQPPAPKVKTIQVNEGATTMETLTET